VLKASLALVAVIVWLGGCASDGSDRQATNKHEAAPTLVAQHKGRPIAIVRSGPHPNFTIAAFGSIWVTHGAGFVSRVDPASDRVEARIPVHLTPGPLSAGLGSVWVADTGGGVTRIDPQKNRVIGVIHVSGPLTGVAVGFGHVWATSSVQDALYEIGARSHKVLKTLSVFDASAVATGLGAVWVAGGTSSNVVEVEPEKAKVAHRIDVPQGAHNVAVIGGNVWVSSGDSGDAVSRINPKNRRVRSIALEHSSFPDGLAGTDRVVWVGEYQGGRVIAIDPHTVQVVARIGVGAGPAIVAVGFGSLWVANFEGKSLWRLPIRPPS
jgi:streptogramin lyase